MDTEKPQCQCVSRMDTSKCPVHGRPREDERLSPEKRARLREVVRLASPRGSSYEAWIDPPTILALLDDLADQAARLAAVEAVCDDTAQTFIVPTPGTNFGRSRVVRVGLIRAALHPDPSEART